MFSPKLLTDVGHDPKGLQLIMRIYLKVGLSLDRVGFKMGMDFESWPITQRGIVG